MPDPAAELDIRLRRAAFNRALDQADLTGIAAVLAPDVVLVTGTDSAVLAGRKAQLAAWKREFASPPERRNRYLRIPDKVVVSTVEPLALEQGRWTCHVSGEQTASGTYAAKWRQVGGAWAIEAELFVTLE